MIADSVKTINTLNSVAAKLEMKLSTMNMYIDAVETDIDRLKSMSFFDKIRFLLVK